MNLAEYMPTLLASLDTDPDSRLAISLDGLRLTGDSYLIGLDLVKVFIRRAGPEMMSDALREDIARFCRASDIVRGHVKLDDTTYGNLRTNVSDLGGSMQDLADDSEARAIVSRILAAEPVLGWLVADRQDRKGRES